MLTRLLQYRRQGKGTKTNRAPRALLTLVLQPRRSRPRRTKTQSAKGNPFAEAASASPHEQIDQEQQKQICKTAG